MVEARASRGDREAFAVYTFKIGTSKLVGGCISHRMYNDIDIVPMSREELEYGVNLLIAGHITRHSDLRAEL